MAAINEKTSFDEMLQALVAAGLINKSDYVNLHNGYKPMGVSLKGSQIHVAKKVNAISGGPEGGKLFTNYLNKQNATCKLCNAVISDEDVEMYSAAMGLDANYHTPLVPNVCAVCSATKGQDKVVGLATPVVKTLTNIYLPFQPGKTKYGINTYENTFPFNGKPYNDQLEAFFKQSCPSLVAMWSEKTGWGSSTDRRLCFTFDYSSDLQIAKEFDSIVTHLKCCFPLAHWGDSHETIQSINL